MRSCASFPKSGFTLMEMVLAIGVSGILVALLVSVWIQVFRTSTHVEVETLHLRAQESQRRVLKNILGGLIWSSTSHLSQGTLHWEDRNTSTTFWSRTTLGLMPGPARWVVEPAGVAQCQDPDGTQGQCKWDEVQSISLEVLRPSVDLESERLDWIWISQWDPALPFKPLGMRFRVTWVGGGQECLQRIP